MSEVAINNRAVGLVSIGNPVTLITSLDKFKTICPGYKIYICLNVIREHISDENNSMHPVKIKFCYYFEKISKADD